MLYVPVVDKDQRPLMPTTPNRAASWIRSGKATPFWKRGVFCVRLNVPPSGTQTQPVVVGVDPGSKKEGFSVKSPTKTYLNIQADAITWVKSAIETRRHLRRARRGRHTPCRKNKLHRTRKNFLAPSTRARWGWKLRVLDWLKKLFPIAIVVVETIQAKTRPGSRRWNVSFSPLQIGQEWFYSRVRELFPRLETRPGHQTKFLRDDLGLAKSKAKMSEDFHAHCVDSWVLANSLGGTQRAPENKTVLCLTPLRFHRRQLHVQNPIAGGIRKKYGGTRSLGFQRGSVVKHIKHGLSYIGGASNDRVSLHSVDTGQRLCQNAKPADIKVLTHSGWRWHSSPA